MLENEFDRMLEDLDEADNEFNSYFDSPDEALEKEKFKTELEEDMIDTFNDMPKDSEIVDKKEKKANKKVEEFDDEEDFDFTPKVKLGADFDKELEELEDEIDLPEETEEEDLDNSDVFDKEFEEEKEDFDLSEEKEESKEEEKIEEKNEDIDFPEPLDEEETEEPVVIEKEEPTVEETLEKEEIEFGEPKKNIEELDGEEDLEEEFKEIEDSIDEEIEEETEEPTKKRKFSYNDILDRLDSVKTYDLNNVDDILKLIDKCDTADEFYEEIEKIHDK